MIIYLDGPEKAGKTTLARAIVAEGRRTNRRVTVRHWGPVTSDTEYLEHLKTDSLSRDVVVWDRGWASEYVYGTLLRQDRRLAQDPWLGEWLYGRIVETNGVRAIVRGPDVTTLADGRDATDIDVDPGAERELYTQYGLRYNYLMITNDHTEVAARRIATRLLTAVPTYPIHPYHMTTVRRGPVDRIVVGEANSDYLSVPGAWAPFTSWRTTKYGRLLGDGAVTRTMWTNVASLEDDGGRLREFRLAASDAAVQAIVVCGRTAETYVKEALPVRLHDRIIHVPHPAWLYRWPAAEEHIDPTENLLSALGDNHG